MNPSTGEIRKAIDSLNKSEVIVLPNDGNIIASAQHAAEMCDSIVAGPGSRRTPPCPVTASTPGG
jgi:dihydroxyacetone kinase-like predicted kinase